MGQGDLFDELDDAPPKPVAPEPKPAEELSAGKIINTIRKLKAQPRRLLAYVLRIGLVTRTTLECARNRECYSYIEEGMIIYDTSVAEFAATKSDRLEALALRKCGNIPS